MCRRQVGVQVCLANETGSSPLSSLLYAVSGDSHRWSDAGVLCPANPFLVQAQQSPGPSLKEKVLVHLRRLTAEELWSCLR